MAAPMSHPSRARAMLLVGRLLGEGRALLRHHPIHRLSERANQAMARSTMRRVRRVSAGVVVQPAVLVCGAAHRLIEAARRAVGAPRLAAGAAPLGRGAYPHHVAALRGGGVGAAATPPLAAPRGDARRGAAAAVAAAPIPAACHEGARRGALPRGGGASRAAPRPRGALVVARHESCPRRARAASWRRLRSVPLVAPPPPQRALALVPPLPPRGLRHLARYCLHSGAIVLAWQQLARRRLAARYPPQLLEAAVLRLPRRPQVPQIVAHML